MAAAEDWAEQLGAWAIPDEILARAPQPPWDFPPALFARLDEPPGALHRIAADALDEGGTVLDVGCGGGAASLPLAARAGLLVGVDPSPALLDAFTAAAAAAGVGHRAHRGTWPAAAPDVETADVVVCRHVVYNVAGIVPFVTALSGHARRRVVVELTDRHPNAPLAPLWRRFWDLGRPSGPTADLFVEVVRQAGIAPEVTREVRAANRGFGQAEHVAFVRRRLCLPAARDPEVAAALADAGDDTREVVVVAWDPPDRVVVNSW